MHSHGFVQPGKALAGLCFPTACMTCCCDVFAAAACLPAARCCACSVAGLAALSKLQTVKLNLVVSAMDGLTTLQGLSESQNMLHTHTANRLLCAWRCGLHVPSTDMQATVCSWLGLLQPAPDSQVVRSQGRHHSHMSPLPQSAVYGA